MRMGWWIGVLRPAWSQMLCGMSARSSNACMPRSHCILVAVRVSIRSIGHSVAVGMAVGAIGVLDLWCWTHGRVWLRAPRSAVRGVGSDGEWCAWMEEGGGRRFRVVDGGVDVGRGVSKQSKY